MFKHPTCHLLAYDSRAHALKRLLGMRCRLPCTSVAVCQHSVPPEQLAGAIGHTQGRSLAMFLMLCAVPWCLVHPRSDTRPPGPHLPTPRLCRCLCVLRAPSYPARCLQPCPKTTDICLLGYSTRAQGILSNRDPL